jgi:hypothetical protein
LDACPIEDRGQRSDERRARGLRQIAFKEERVPIKKTWRLIVSAAALVALTAAAPAGATVAATPPAVPPLDEGSCAHPALSQPMDIFGDFNTYGLAPGGMFSDATGWQLSGGAKIVSATQYDGTTGSVLELPGKSQATSPVMCITADYPMSRLWSRNVKGNETVSFNVQYYDKATGQWTSPKDNGGFAGPYYWTQDFDWSAYTDDKAAWAAYTSSPWGQWVRNSGIVSGVQAGWRLSREMAVTPSVEPGWQQVRFTLLAGGDARKSNIQVDGFWVDPRASR